MTPELNTLYAFTLGYCETLAAEIPEEQMRHQPAPGVNSPAWLLGHLALVADMMAASLGGEAKAPKAWNGMFGMGSDPAKLGDDCPTKSELLAALRDGHERLTAASAAAAPETLAKPNPIGLLSKPLPTLGDLVAHVMSTHEAMHAGHLSNWRRQMGHPPLF